MKSALLIFSFCFVILSGYGQLGNLVWEENFNSDELNLGKWTYETGTGVNGDWGTGQIDRATNRTENVSFQNNVPGANDGCLMITTREEFFIDRNYTSGRINSAGKASWGSGHRIVARVYPRDINHKGQGFAFWMMPDEIPSGWNYIMWPQGGEIDIMEYVGSIPFNNLGSVHYAWFWENNEWQEWNHGHQGAYYNYESQEVPIPSEPGYGGYPPAPGDPNAGSFGFHTYGIDWYANRIEFFVDDNVYHIHYLNDGGAFQDDGQDGFAISQIENRRVAKSEYSSHFDEWHPFEHKMYAILSAGVGGATYTYGGAIVPEAEFPCSVFIDWVRVYELEANATAENENSSGFKIFPNPTNGLLNFEMNNPENYNIRITDISGKTIIHTSLDRSAALDISVLKKGSYLVLATKGKFTLSRKIIIL